MNQEYKHIVDRICAALGISLADLSRDLKITRSAVNEWKRKNAYIPVEHCKYLENRLRGTSDPLTCIDMRPGDWDKYWPGHGMPDDGLKVKVKECEHFI